MSNSLLYVVSCALWAVGGFFAGMAFGRWLARFDVE